MRVTSMLERLQDQSASDRLHLQQSLVEFGEAADEDNDVQDANNPLMDKVIEEAGDEAFRVLTNFTPSEFDIIWANVERAMNSKWFEGRGRKSKMTPKDDLHITLTVLKHYQSSEKHAVDFNLKAPTLEKIVVKVVELCSPILYNTFVTMPTMTSLGRKFVHYPYALYATDVKFQPPHRPSGRFGEQMHYFSGKHKL
ncbi:hypothetical protein H257_16970 [Aphanomyces astaci]|uniref:Uncharacterized protein n=1 Tax=Aphanomyces astaci TaxID=112090 RepID=W4FIW4_APHAT|nr:hypothetical protein H257_16970 [Aphanomyces astaci]ETV66668.1 hypothetical protein H257_16970 [Aphanomyces astaci]|eukprot:XP_009843896.1 hypothetical protein H257_16970 [Aphanomyces astaci]